ncbi:hypothetical protein SDC9_131685 [bioreactor metagenome]|uniref:Uncharacterized protein n=1 Tax=bioreactor metagenome TaxID=1076179 RepID=A0A645D7L6_9ZZZZ
MGLGERAFSGLYEGDRVLAVLGSHVEAADLSAHLFRNGKARGVVARAVDAVTGRELFSGFGHVVVVDRIHTMGVHGRDVVLNTHVDILQIFFSITRRPVALSLVKQHWYQALFYGSAIYLVLPEAELRARAREKEKNLYFCPKFYKRQDTVTFRFYRLHSDTNRGKIFNKYCYYLAAHRGAGRAA